MPLLLIDLRLSEEAGPYFAHSSPRGPGRHSFGLMPEVLSYHSWEGWHLTLGTNSSVLTLLSEGEAARERGVECFGFPQDLFRWHPRGLERSVLILGTFTALMREEMMAWQAELENRIGRTGHEKSRVMNFLI